MIVTWSFRAAVDPRCKRGDVLRCKLRFLARRHVRLYLLGDGLDEQGAIGFARLNGGSAFAAFYQRLECFHRKLAFKVNVIVAAGTVLAQDRSNVLVEINRFPESRQGDQRKNERK